MQSQIWRLTGDAVAVGTASRSPRLQDRLLSPFVRLMAWTERRRQIQALSELDGRLLKDVGLTPHDVLRARRTTLWP